MSPDNIHVQLGVFADVSGTVHRGFANANVSDVFNLQFDLTSESILSLSGTTSTFGGGSSPLDSVIAQIVLSGPDFQFQAPPPYGTFDFVFPLEPGIYDLTATTAASLVTGNNYSGFTFQDASASLNAEFTPIPEPRYSALVLALVAAVCVLRHCVRRFAGGGSTLTCRTGLRGIAHS